MKIFYNGKQARTAAGRFDSFKAKSRRAFRSTKKWTMILGVFAAAVFVVSSMLATTTVTATSTINTIDLMPEKIAYLKADVIDQISDCERAGYTEDDGLIVFDSNAKASIGIMQFQVKTVIHYEKLLYGHDINGKDAILIALDSAKAKALATDIVFEKDGLANWLNCANKLGLRAQVNAITKISQ